MKVYFFGGLDKLNAWRPQTTVDSFDLEDETWQFQDDLAAPSRFGHIVLLKEKILTKK